MDDRKHSAHSHTRDHLRTTNGIGRTGDVSSPVLHPEKPVFKRSKSSDSLVSRRSQVRMAPLKQVKSHARIPGLKRATSGVSIIQLDQQYTNAVTTNHNHNHNHNDDVDRGRKKPLKPSKSKFDMPEDDGFEDTDDEVSNENDNDIPLPDPKPADSKSHDKARTPSNSKDELKDPFQSHPPPPLLQHSSPFMPAMLKNLPAPPQISSETVVSVSSPEVVATEIPRQPAEAKLSAGSNSTKADIDSSTDSDHMLRSRFLTDLNSHSSWVDLERLHAKDSSSSKASPSSSMGSNGFQSNLESSPRSSLQTRTQQRLWLQRQQSIDPELMRTLKVDSEESEDVPYSQRILTMAGWSTGEHAVQLTYEQRREIDRISKEFNSIRRFNNPLLETVQRSRTIRQGRSTFPQLVPPKRHPLTAESASQGLSQSLPKRITSLSATTLNKLADMDSSNDSSSRRSRVTAGTAGSAADLGTIPYLLSRMWSEGWLDRTDKAQEEAAKEQRPPSSINAQAQMAAAHLQRPTANTASASGNSIKLV